MNDRIHSWLDGEIPLEDLSAEERKRAFAIHHWLRAAEDLHDTPAPGISDRVMNALPPGPPPQKGAAPWKGLLEGLHRGFSYRPVRLGHAAAMAAICLVLGFGLGQWRALGDSPTTTASAPDTATATAAPAVFVRFDLEVNDANSVHLAGSFSDWEPRHELTHTGDGLWTITIPLDPGVHDYVFVVNGEHHLLDPSAPRIADGFGSFSNRLALLTSAS